MRDQNYKESKLENEQIAKMKKYFLAVQKCLEPIKRFNSLRNQQQYNQLLQSKKKQLKQPQLLQSVKKILFVDIDETLIHSSLSNQNQQETQGTFIINQQINSSIIRIACKTRPNYQNFILNMSKLYDIYLFTASQQLYANQIFNIINKQVEHVIKGVFSRSHCVKITNQLYVKDPRIFKNLKQQNFAILDNEILSFYPLLDNGIPISAFLGKQDQQLNQTASFLTHISTFENITIPIRQRFRLKQINCIIQQNQFKTINV